MNKLIHIKKERRILRIYIPTEIWVRQMAHIKAIEQALDKYVMLHNEEDIVIHINCVKGLAKDIQQWAWSNMISVFLDTTTSVNVHDVIIIDHPMFREFSISAEKLANTLCKEPKFVRLE